MKVWLVKLNYDKYYSWWLCNKEFVDYLFIRTTFPGVVSWEVKMIDFSDNNLSFIESYKIL